MRGHCSPRGQIGTGTVQAALAGPTWALHSIVGWVAVRGKYRVGRIAEDFSQIHQGKPLVRRAKIAVTEYDSKNDLYKVEHIYRDIAHCPVGGLRQ